MNQCSLCGANEPGETFGVIICAAVLVRGVKSGQTYPEEDYFPDGDERKFICMACLPTELVRALHLLGE